jgi:hypothetical protein
LDGSAAGTRSCLYPRGLRRAGDGALETTADETIRGLGTASRVCASGLSSFLESGHRVDASSPTVAGRNPDGALKAVDLRSCDIARHGWFLSRLTIS